MTRRRIVEMFRVGKAFHGYIYKAAVAEPGLYKRERGYRGDADEVLWLFHVEDLGWFAVEAPQVVDGRDAPDKEWLWANGKKVFWRKHCAVRDGWHRWAAWDERAEEWDTENTFWRRTEVASTLPCRPTDDHGGILDLEDDPSDSDLDEAPADR